MKKTSFNYNNNDHIQQQTQCNSHSYKRINNQPVIFPPYNTNTILTSSKTRMKATLPAAGEEGAIVNSTIILN